MKVTFSVSNVGFGRKRGLYERTDAKRVTYGAETWGLKTDERNKLDVLEM